MKALARGARVREREVGHPIFHALCAALAAALLFGLVLAVALLRDGPA